jgi:hypothetical protein
MPKLPSKSDVSLSSSFAPFHSVEITGLKPNSNSIAKVVEMGIGIENTSAGQQILLLVGKCFHNQLQQTSNQVVNATTEKVKMEQELNQLELKTRKAKLV